ncbi:MAG: hypothetical protein ACTSU2_02850 [Promethearchaeota archaeon]
MPGKKECSPADNNNREMAYEHTTSGSDFAFLWSLSNLMGFIWSNKKRGIKEKR